MLRLSVSSSLSIRQSSNWSLSRSQLSPIIQNLFWPNRLVGPLDNDIGLPLPHAVLVHQRSHVLASARLVALPRRMAPEFSQGAPGCSQYPIVVDGLCQRHPVVGRAHVGCLLFTSWWREIEGRRGREGAEHEDGDDEWTRTGTNFYGGEEGVVIDLPFGLSFHLGIDEEMSTGMGVLSSIQYCQ